MQHLADIQDESISLKDIVEKARYLIFLLISNIKIIIIGTLCFIVIIGSYFTFREKKFSAVTTFMLEEATPQQSLFSLIPGLTLTGSQPIDVKKTVDILSTRLILSNALLKKSNLKNKNDFLINHLIELYGFRDIWKGSTSYPNLEKIVFTNDRQEKFTLNERYAMGVLCAFIKKKLLILDKSANDIISVRVTSKNEEFSKQLSISIVDAFVIFYAENAIVKEKGAINNMELQLDSVKNELFKSELRLARWKDESSRLIKAQGYLEEIRLTRDVQVLNVLYGEIIKNLETLKVKLNMQKATLIKIDTPVIPLATNKVNIFKILFITGFLGCCFWGGYVILKDLVLKNLRE